MWRNCFTSLLPDAQRCKNILASNWRAQLSMDGTDWGELSHAKEVYCILSKEKPYVWLHEKDAHDMNSAILSCGWLSISSPVPEPNLLSSIYKSPAKVVLTGGVSPLKDEKAKLALESVKEVIKSEERKMNEFTHEVTSAVSGVLGSSNYTIPKHENLKKLLRESGRYRGYSFSTRFCSFTSVAGSISGAKWEDVVKSRPDPLGYISANIIDGINRSKARRKALTRICSNYCDVDAEDAFVVSVDCKGFDVMAYVKYSTAKGGFHHEWSNFRIQFIEKKASDVETFCQYFSEMEMKALKGALALPPHLIREPGEDGELETLFV